MNPSHNVIMTLGGIWGLLAVASFIVWVLTFRKPNHDYHELVQRTKSWWVMLSIFSIALLTNRIVSLVFLAFVSFLALKECFSIISTRRVDRRVLFWAYLAVPIQFYWVAIGWFDMFIIFIPVYMFLFIPFRLVLNQETDGFLKSAGSIQWVLMITVFALSHVAYLLALPSTKEVQISGAGLLLFLVFLTQFNDVAQYVCGKTMGKHKIIPGVSPKKTWEGFLGGIVCTTIAAILIYPLLTPFSLKIAVIAGALISLAGFVGDVTISALKRDLHIKDTGAMIPGHGGILDRVDSLTFAAPLFFHLAYYIYF